VRAPPLSGSADERCQVRCPLQPLASTCCSARECVLCFSCVRALLRTLVRVCGCACSVLWSTSELLVYVRTSDEHAYLRRACATPHCCALLCFCCALLCSVFLVSCSEMASPSVPPSGGAQIPRCPVIFDGTNYHEWVPHMRWHMRGLQLWEFLSGELPCPVLPDRPVQPVIPPGTSEDEQKKLCETYDDDMASYMSHFRAYRTC
jgi:hypothetical protein